jgi:hypothetical protein
VGTERKQVQNPLDGIDDSDRIESGYPLFIFYKSIRTILLDHKKPLSWLAFHAGKSKPWWGYALQDAKLTSRERKTQRSAIVVHGRELKSAVLIANLLKEYDDSASDKLAARLGVLRAQAELNDKINALVRIR